VNIALDKNNYGSKFLI